MDKQQLLSLIATALQQGVITSQDLAPFVPAQPISPASIALSDAVVAPQVATTQVVTPQALAPQEASQAPVPLPTITDNSTGIYINPVTLLYYVVGIILFVALMKLLEQIWYDTNVIVHLLFTLVAGVALWSAAAYMLKRKTPLSDAQTGFVDTTILTGSLCILASTIVIDLAIGDYPPVVTLGLTTSITLVLIGILHLVYDRLVHQFVPIVMGTLVLSGSILPVLLSLASQNDAAPEGYAVIFFAGAGLLYASGLYAARTAPQRALIRFGYTTLATFVTLLTIFVMTLSSSSAAVLWQIILVIAVYATFYLSIRQRSKGFLANATLFLVISSVSFSFRYFSDAGAVVSLVISAIAILISAFIANTINKKYLRA